MEFWKESFETPPFKEKKDEAPAQPQKVKKERKKRRKLPAIIILFLLIAGLFIYLQWPRFELVPLGSFGGPFGSAESINNKGQIVGWSQLSNGFTHAFICESDKKIEDIGTLGGQNSYARAINDEGQVVGYAETSDGANRAFIWDTHVGMKEIEIPQAESSEAVSINNNGQVVGFYKKEGNQRYAFLWDRRNGITEIISPYDKLITPKEINDSGQVVGYMYSPKSKEHAFYWDKESGTIDIVGENGQISFATGINNKGQVVGNIFSTRINNYSGFIWTKESGLKDLKISKIKSNINKISDSKQMVGDVSTAKFLFIPKKNFTFFRTSFGLIINLQKFGKTEKDIIKAESINNNNWIVGQIESSALQPRYQPVLIKPEKSKLKDIKNLIPLDFFKKDKNSEK